MPMDGAVGDGAASGAVEEKANIIEDDVGGDKGGDGGAAANTEKKLEEDRRREEQDAALAREIELEEAKQLLLSSGYDVTQAKAAPAIPPTAPPSLPPAAKARAIKHIEHSTTSGKLAIATKKTLIIDPSKIDVEATVMEQNLADLADRMASTEKFQCEAILEIVGVEQCSKDKEGRVAFELSEAMIGKMPALRDLIDVNPRAYRDNKGKRTTAWEVKIQRKFLADRFTRMIQHSKKA